MLKLLLIETITSIPFRSLEREASERSDPTALGLTTLCKKYMFIATLMLMTDVLSYITRLSLLYQREEIDFA